MQGFDPRFKDFPDYILGITREIWEDRNIAILHQYYSDDILVRSPVSLVRGNQGVIAATMATLSEFPDRTLYGEDIIWAGTPEDGMLSSHRLHSAATHSGSGIYGEATGKTVRYRIIADCHAINNQINDEWIVRDQGAIVQQLGWKPADYARKMIAHEGGADKAQIFLPENDIQGPYRGRGNDNPWGERLAEILQNLMNADFALIPKAYDRAANVFYPGGRDGLSHGDVDRFWLSLRASFPNAKFDVHHVMGQDNPLMSPRAAVRWSLDGTHDGWGHYGKPTGARVYIMGMTQVEFGPWGIRREYTIFDETIIWKQIILHTGDL